MTTIRQAVGRALHDAAPGQRFTVELVSGGPVMGGDEARFGPPAPDSDLHVRVAWLEAQVRSLAATAYGPAGQPHDCWAAVFPPDNDEPPDATPSTAVQQAVDAAKAALAVQVAERVVDLIEHWEAKASVADRDAMTYREAHDFVRAAEADGEANQLRHCIANLRVGGVL